MRIFGARVRGLRKRPAARSRRTACRRRTSIPSREGQRVPFGSSRFKKLVKKPGGDGGWRFRPAPGLERDSVETRLAAPLQKKLVLGRRRHVLFHAGLVLSLELCQFGFLIGGQDLHH